MIDCLAGQGRAYLSDGHVARLARVMLDELAEMQRQRFNLPISTHSKIRLMADALTFDPADRTTLKDWPGMSR